jgi:enamine deaminase RidA (YjgF/YER057c/UK114 family)
VTRQNIASDSPYEDVVGFSRAVRKGSFIAVSGTVGRQVDMTMAEGAYAQMRQAIANIEAALKQAGASLSDVVRTRIYVADMAYLDDVARAHKEAFDAIRPASSMVQAHMVEPGMLIEVEADAVVDG